MRELQKDAEKKHKEVLDLIEILAENSSDRASSVSHLNYFF
jgi:hypothetical protein